MSAIIGWLGSSIFGSIFGGLMGCVNKYLDLKQHAMDQTHELALRDKDMEQTKVEIEGRAKVAEVQAAGATAVAENQAFAASFEADKATYGIKAVDFFRGIVRPLITGGACFEIFICARAATAYMDAHGGMSIDQAYAIVDAVLFTAFTVVLWWFGSRPKQKA